MVEPLPPHPHFQRRKGPVTLVILDGVGIHGWQSQGGWADIIALVMFGLLCFTLLRAARQKLA